MSRRATVAGGRGARDADFTELVRPELPRLLRAAVLLCGDWHQAEDLVQAVLARFYAGGRWQRVDTPYGYLRASVTNEYLARRRRRSASEITVAEHAEGSFGSWEDPDPAQRIDLFRALDQLSRLDRAVLVLRYYEDLSVIDTAAVLSISPGAVRTRCGRALIKVRSLLDEPPPVPRAESPTTERMPR